jgi:hypothetical protein
MTAAATGMTTRAVFVGSGVLASAGSSTCVQVTVADSNVALLLRRDPSRSLPFVNSISAGWAGCRGTVGFRVTEGWAPPFRGRQEAGAGALVRPVRGVLRGQRRGTCWGCCGTSAGALAGLQLNAAPMPVAEADAVPCQPWRPSSAGSVPARGLPAAPRRM